MARRHRRKSNSSTSDAIPTTAAPPPAKNLSEKMEKKVRAIFSKIDVIVMMKGIVDYIALKGVDPAINLGDFVDFINRKSNSAPNHAFSKVSWELRRVSDDEINYVLRLKSNDSGNNDSVVNFNNVSGVGDKVLSLGKNCEGFRVSSVGIRWKKVKAGGNDGGKKAKSRENGGGVRVLSVENCGKTKKKTTNEGMQKAGLGGNGGNRKKKYWVSGIVARVKSRKRSCVKAVSNANVSGSKKKVVAKGNENVRKEQRREKKKNNMTMENNCSSKKRKLLTIVNNSGQNSIVLAKNVKKKNNGQKRRKIDEESLNDVEFWQRNEPKLRELQSNISWCAPSIGVLKWNTDASLRDGSTAAIGGVLRDWLGSFCCLFSCRVDCIDVNEAEVRAIYKALELTSCNALLSSNMVVESDSMTAVRWCNDNAGGPPHLSFMLSFIRVCRMLWQGLEIKYTPRESNTVADYLSKQGHSRSSDFVAWMM